jgi:hypothetical protein
MSDLRKTHALKQTNKLLKQKMTPDCQSAKTSLELQENKKTQPYLKSE